MVATLMTGAMVSPATADPAFLRTTAPLDEARGYCINIRGQAASLQITESLQAHTCKVTNWVDMLIDDGLGEAPGPMVMPEYVTSVSPSMRQPTAVC